MASRILGMGDIVSLVEEARKSVDEGEAKKLADKFKKGKDFDLDDFKSQIQQMKKMGGVSRSWTSCPRSSPRPRGQSPDLQEKSIPPHRGIINP